MRKLIIIVTVFAGLAAVRTAQATEVPKTSVLDTECFMNIAASSDLTPVTKSQETCLINSSAFKENTAILCERDFSPSIKFKTYLRFQDKYNFVLNLLRTAKNKTDKEQNLVWIRAIEKEWPVEGFQNEVDVSMDKIRDAEADCQKNIR